MKTIREALEALEGMTLSDVGMRRTHEALLELDAAEQRLEKIERRAVEAEKENATLARELRDAREKMAAIERRLGAHHG